VKNLKTFYYPESVEEALKILRNESEKARIIAGGTSVSFSKDQKVEALVDITRLGLNYIKEEVGYLVIGATTSIQDLVKSDLVKNLADGALSKAASEVASRQIRNVVTMGGNIVELRIWSDLATVLLALDGQIKVTGFMEKNIPAEDFFREHPTKILESDEIVTEIFFPLTPKNSGAEYYKVGKTKDCYPTLTLGCYLEFDDKTCTLARIAVGSVAPLPTRCRKAEKFLMDKKIDEAIIEEAAEIARGETKTISNNWGGAEYRSVILENLAKKALHSCMEKAKMKKE